MGAIGVVISYVNTVIDCQSNCQVRHWCTVFNFHKMFQYCTLSGTTTVNVQPDPYFLTGTRTCGNNGSELKIDFKYYNNELHHKN